MNFVYSRRLYLSGGFSNLEHLVYFNILLKYAKLQFSNTELMGQIITPLAVHIVWI